MGDWGFVKVDCKMLSSSDTHRAVNISRVEIKNLFMLTEP